MGHSNDDRDDDGRHADRDRPRRRHRRDRSASRSPPRRRHRHSSSPSPASARSRSPRHRRRHRDSRSASPSSHSRRPRRPLPPQDEHFRGQGHGDSAGGPPPPKEKPNFKATGALAADSNKVTIGSGNKTTNVVLKYHEPPEARKPPSKEPWAMYVFKGATKDPLHTLPLHSRSCWLFGREAAVADVPTEHPSCSKQHAVLQFRHSVTKDEYGERKSRVKLYVLDLESANGTFLNDERIDAARYVECRSGDVLKFGDSQREYVLLLPPNG